VGQAIVQGVSKQYKQRAASMAAWRAFMRGVMSEKFASYCSGVNFGAASRRGIRFPHVHPLP
jgi:hypothetical protein